MGLSVEVLRKPPKPVPKEVAQLWAAEWATEGKKVDSERLMPQCDAASDASGCWL